MDVVLVVVGVVLVVVSFADLVNTLVTTATSYARWWPTRLVWESCYAVLRGVAARLPDGSTARERVLAAFAPLLLVALLSMWSALQVVGFGLVWHAIGGLEPTGGLGDSLYYSGVVFFTIGFGEVVPEDVVPRVGALIEAFAGVATTALVIGYLPSLYAAYSERERPLMTLDHGEMGRITPVTLIKAWAPDADPKKLEERFREWERWTATVLETHATLPLLRLFRSHDRRQHWVTALGVVTDAALFAQQILGAYDGHGYWLIRRATVVFDEMTAFASERQLAPYYEQRDEIIRRSDGTLFREARQELIDHGFELVPEDVGMEHVRRLRDGYAAELEFLIDYLLAPRGFWPPSRIEVPLLSSTHPEMLDYRPGDLGADLDAGPDVGPDGHPDPRLDPGPPTRS